VTSGCPTIRICESAEGGGPGCSPYFWTVISTDTRSFLSPPSVPLLRIFPKRFELFAPIHPRLWPSCVKEGPFPRLSSRPALSIRRPCSPRKGRPPSYGDRFFFFEESITGSTGTSLDIPYGVTGDAQRPLIFDPLTKGTFGSFFRLTRPLREIELSSVKPPSPFFCLWDELFYPEFFSAATSPCRALQDVLLVSYLRTLFSHSSLWK